MASKLWQGWSFSKTFFIYDHEIVKREEDDPKMAVIYFDSQSQSVSEDTQSLFCGQVMAMVSFLENLVSSKPSLYCMKKMKMAAVHEGRFSMVMASSINTPDELATQKLQNLHGLFKFFQGSLYRILEMHGDDHEAFSGHVASMMPSYSSLVSPTKSIETFQNIPMMVLPKNSHLTYLEASHLLQWLKRRPKLLAGCIIYKNKIVCTQLTTSLTRYLYAARSQEILADLQAITAPAPLPLPEGVQIRAVFLTQQEYCRYSKNERPDVATCSKVDASPDELAHQKRLLSSDRGEGEDCATDHLEGKGARYAEGSGEEKNGAAGPVDRTRVAEAGEGDDLEGNVRAAESHRLGGRKSTDQEGKSEGGQGDDNRSVNRGSLSKSNKSPDSLVKRLDFDTASTSTEDSTQLRVPMCKMESEEPPEFNTLRAMGEIGNGFSGQEWARNVSVWIRDEQYTGETNNIGIDQSASLREEGSEVKACDQNPGGNEKGEFVGSVVRARGDPHSDSDNDEHGSGVGYCNTEANRIEKNSRDRLIMDSTTESTPAQAKYNSKDSRHFSENKVLQRIQVSHLPYKTKPFSNHTRNSFVRVDSRHLFEDGQSSEDGSEEGTRLLDEEVPEGLVGSVIAGENSWSEPSERNRGTSRQSEEHQGQNISTPVSSKSVTCQRSNSSMSFRSCHDTTLPTNVENSQTDSDDVFICKADVGQPEPPIGSGSESLSLQVAGMITVSLFIQTHSKDLTVVFLGEQSLQRDRQEINNIWRSIQSQTTELEKSLKEADDRKVKGSSLGTKRCMRFNTFEHSLTVETCSDDGSFFSAARFLHDKFNQDVDLRNVRLSTGTGTAIASREAGSQVFNYMPSADTCLSLVDKVVTSKPPHPKHKGVFGL